MQTWVQFINWLFSRNCRCQTRSNNLIVLNQQYDLPRGRMDTFLDDEFSDIIEGVMVHKWNFEHLDGCFAAHQIGEQSWSIQAWKDSTYDTLVKKAERDTRKNLQGFWYVVRWSVENTTTRESWCHDAWWSPYKQATQFQKYWTCRPWPHGRNCVAKIP